jgi:hypothetical protein
MTQSPAQCPQCDATIGLFSSARHARCAYCGCRFVVDWSEPEAPQLTAFEDVLKTAPTGVSSPVANAKAGELELAAANAGAEVESRRKQAQIAEEAHDRKVRAAHRAIAAPQSQTLALGVTSALVIFMVTFVLENAWWYIGLILAVLLVLLTRMAYLRWQRTEDQALARLIDSRQGVQQAQSSLEESLAIQDDRRLEQELWQARAAAGSSGVAASA